MCWFHDGLHLLGLGWGGYVVLLHRFSLVPRIWGVDLSFFFGGGGGGSDTLMVRCWGFRVFCGLLVFAMGFGELLAVPIGVMISANV